MSNNPTCFLEVGSVGGGCSLLLSSTHTRAHTHTDSQTHTHTYRKMAAAVLVLLLCAGAVLEAAEAQDAYAQLPEDYRTGVDLALEHLSSHDAVQHHFRFLRSVEKSDIESGFGVKYFYHHFYLKPTRCPKGAGGAQTCPFRNDRPLMDCAVCYKTSSGQMENNPAPYVHCIQRPRLTETMKTTRTEHCKRMHYNSGAPTLLAVKHQ